MVRLDPTDAHGGIARGCRILGGSWCSMLAKLSSYTPGRHRRRAGRGRGRRLGRSMPKTVLVGLAEAAVKESTHRVERAIVNSGYRRPIDRVVINLAPADLKKDAGGFDLPIALGLLLGSGQVAFERPGNFAIVGELALTGETRPVKGVLSMAMPAAAEGRDGLLVPARQRRRGGRRRGARRLPGRQPGRGGRLPLRPAGHRPRGGRPRRALRASTPTTTRTSSTSRARTTPSGASLIAAAGGHNVLMIGPPGTGKTLLAKRLPTILPPLTPAESLETTRIYSAMGRLRAGEPLMAVRPFRTPHHSVSDAGLVGGGSPPQPGRSRWPTRGSSSSTRCPSSTARRSRSSASRWRRARSRSAGP